MAWSIPWNLIGLQVSGDFGDTTIYTDRYNRKVVYPKSPPKEPPSPAQVQSRDAFRAAQASWAALSVVEKAALENACRRTSIPLTGQNLWIHCQLTGDSQAYTTIQRQSGITLPPL